MKLFNYSELANVQIDENFDDEDFSYHIDNALTYGFDEEFPIVVDEDGLIIDGNHRFVAFQNENRLDEVVFCVVNNIDYTSLVSKMIDEKTINEFNKDNDFFYSQIKTIAL